MNIKYRRVRVGLFYKGSGFSIIEILIGIVISTIIAMGVGSVYLSVRSIQNSQLGVTEIRDSAFIIFDRIEYALKQANYINYQQQYKITSIQAVYTLDSPILDTSSDAISTGASDKIIMQMNIPDYANEMTNCIGGSVPINTDTLKYTIQQEFSVKNSKLYCRIKSDVLDLTSNIKTNNSFGSDNLVTKGVNNMQIFYALYTDNGCGIDITSADNNIWKTASQLISSDWVNICAVNIALVTSSNTKQVMNIKDETNTKYFDLRPNTEIVDNYADNVVFTPSDNLVSQLRFTNKIIRLRN